MHLPINKAQGCNKGGKEAAVTQEETDAGVTAGGETAQHQSTATAHSDPKKFTFDFTSRSRFNLVAATSSMEDVDIKKAVSDMEKDPVLDQYSSLLELHKRCRRCLILGLMQMVQYPSR